MTETATSPSPRPEEYTGLTEDQIRRATELVAATALKQSTILPPKTGERTALAGVTVEQIASKESTALLRDEVLNHGATIDRDGIRTPNTVDFMNRYGLDRSDMDAVGFYRGGGALLVNDYLRGRGRPPFEKLKHERFMELFAQNGKLPMTKGGEVVFRGMPGMQSSDAAWQEQGFSSTTVSEAVAKGFARSAQKRDGTGRLVRMVMPPGVRYLPMGTGEEEVVFEPGLTITPIAHNAFESGVEGIDTIDALIQKAIPDQADAS